MKRFLYTGPMQSFALRVADPDAGENVTKLVPVDCIPGQPVELPEDHPITVALDDAGFLAPAPIAAEAEFEPATDAAAATPSQDAHDPHPAKPAGELQE